MLGGWNAPAAVTVVEAYRRPAGDFTMSKAKLIGIGVAVAALAATPAFAQTSSPSTTRPSTSAPSASPAKKAMPSDIKAMKASELIGEDVYSATDERIGEVDDVVVSKSGKQPMAVIGVGGFLGIGEKKAAVPVDQLKVQGDKIVASGLTKDSLKAQAEYKSAEYDKYDRERTVGEAMSGATGSGGATSSGSSGSSTPTGSGSSTGTPPASPSGSSGMGSSTGTGSSTAPSAAPPSPATGSGASGSGSSSGTSTQTPKQ
jgi:sporulation protein YlmC with PRC-barrel domain